VLEPATLSASPWNPAATWRCLQERSTDGTNRLDPALDRAFWARIAPGYHAECLAARVPEVVARVLRWVEPGDTVLELGAGTGGFTLPIAHRAARITAVDYSAAMLAELRDNMRRAPRGNIAIVEADFEHIPLPPHDVVLAANALYRVRDVAPLAERLLAAARKRLLVVWSVGRAQPWERAARALIAPGRYRPGPDYVHLLNVLYDLGADAEVELLRISSWRQYPTEAEAARALACWPDPTADELQRCQALLPRLFEPLPDGGYRVRMHDRVALIRCETTQ